MKDMLPFPINRSSEKDAHLDFARLKEISFMDLFVQKEWKSRSELDPAYVVPYVIKRNNVGNKSSDFYHWNVRMACDSANSPSPIRSWYDRKIRKSVENCIYYEDDPKTALALRKYIPPQFRPSAAKALYELFNAKRIYDPCGGWGDRLSAALASNAEEYHCRDVNPLVFGGYALQQMQLPSDCHASFEYRGSEIDAPQTNHYDLVFTSPPYYKIEKYHGDNQSFRKYKACDEWLEGFLFPMISHAWNSVEHGGHVLINISDCYVNHTYNKLCMPLIEHCLDKLDGCRVLGIIGYQITSRSKNGVNAEPIIIFQKGGGKDLLDLLPKDDQGSLF